MLLYRRAGRHPVAAAAFRHAAERSEAVAATGSRDALALAATLVTSNLAHFQRIAGLTVRRRP